MTAESVDYDEDEINDWPSQMGRTPIGPPIRMQLSTDAHLALSAVAEPFGQRRRSAVIRVALGRILHDHTDLAAIVEEREHNRGSRPTYPRNVNMHVDEDLAQRLSDLADAHHITRAELIRIAVDRFLVELSQLRLAGTPFDIETAINDEIFNGEARRDLLIRRRQRREAERLNR